MQNTLIHSQITIPRRTFPDANTELMPGVRWGTIDAFPTPAYWAYQIFYRRLSGKVLNYRLGQTLAEEVSACILGGHGIPANVGLAAFNHLRRSGAFIDKAPTQDQLLEWLTQPIVVSGRETRYRFAAQKSKYLAETLRTIQNAPPTKSGRILRDWLRDLPGIGYKTASWIARNWLNADDVAILDIHILRFGQAVGLFPKGFTVARNYVELEDLFLDFCHRLDVRPSELDAVIWHEMAASPRSVKYLMREMKRNSL